MGNYTEIVFGCRMKSDLPEYVENVLHYMFDVGAGGYESIKLSQSIDLMEHEFFRCARWGMLGRSCSQYFGAVSNSQICKDGVTNSLRLDFRCSLKNYDNEIQKFIEWIKPYIEQGAGKANLLGYYISEDDAEPTMIFL